MNFLKEKDESEKQSILPLNNSNKEEEEEEMLQNKKDINESASKKMNRQK